VPGKPLDASRLQEVLYSPGKVIKGAGKRIYLRVGTVAASQIIVIDEMASTG
jgi:hypothetical protein